MSSRLVVNSVRHTGASADALTLDSSGGVTIPTKKLKLKLELKRLINLLTNWKQNQT